MDLISFEQIATKGLACVLEMAQWVKTFIISQM